MPFRFLCTSVGLLSSNAPLSKEPEVVRTGLVQMKAREFDKDYNLGQAERLIRVAAARGARIVCTPEVAVQGYPRASFPEGTSWDDPAIAKKREEILSAAEPIPGPSTEFLAGLARELGIWMVFGIDENRDNKLLNSAVLVNSEGVVVGKYSKVHLQNWMLASGVSRGDEFPVWEIEIDGVKLKVGIQICYDIQHPEASRELALGDAEIVFVPYCTSDFARPLLVQLFQTRALENRAFIARANFAADRSNGASSIIDFKGSTLAQLDDCEGVLIGDLDLTALREVRTAWNKVYGPSNRHPAAYKRLRLD